MKTWNETHKDYLMSLVKETKGNLEQAAKVSGLGRATLYRQIYKYRMFDVVEHVREQAQIPRDYYGRPITRR